MLDVPALRPAGGESKMMLLSPLAPNSVYQADIEYGKIISEWSFQKDQVGRLTKRPLVYRRTVEENTRFYLKNAATSVVCVCVL